jgi:predicted nucleotidyltransferase
VRNWQGRDLAESLRQWPTLLWIAERVQAHAQLDGLIAIGSFAKGSADDASDLDLIAVVAADAFERVWSEREECETPGAVFGWDQTDDLGVEEGVRKFLTVDMVKVELVFTTGRDFVLAEPYAVLVGEESLPDRFQQRRPISSGDLDAYAQSRVDSGVVPEVEVRYGEFMSALRTVIQQHRSPRP